jgi:hypothetical protein
VDIHCSHRNGIQTTIRYRSRSPPVYATLIYETWQTALEADISTGQTASVQQGYANLCGFLRRVEVGAGTGQHLCTRGIPIPLLRVLEGFGTTAKRLHMPKTELYILKYMLNLGNVMGLQTRAGWCHGCLWVWVWVGTL